MEAATTTAGETVVMKFGGTSVADAERLTRAARRIVARAEEGKGVVVVLSARGKETDRLIADAYEISEKPDPREMDMLLSTGERISCALCAMAIRDADFEATLALIRDVGFAQAFSFKYSARPGTPAAGLPNQVSEAEKGARLHALQALLAEQQRAFNAAAVGRVLPVLFEKDGRHAGQLIGRSPYLQAVHAVAPPRLAGEIAPVRILAVGPNSLAGELAVAEEAA